MALPRRFRAAGADLPIPLCQPASSASSRIPSGLAKRMGARSPLIPSGPQHPCRHEKERELALLRRRVAMSLE